MTDEWIKKMWYIHTMEYYSAIKRNDIGSFVEKPISLDAAANPLPTFSGLFVPTPNLSKALQTSFLLDTIK